MLRRALLLAGLLVAACGEGRDAPPAASTPDGSTTDAATLPCTGTAPYCLPCWGDIGIPAQCTGGVWTCTGGAVLDRAECAGRIGGPCAADGACPENSACYRGTCLPWLPCATGISCRRVPDPQQPTACECAPVRAVCYAPPGPGGELCPDGTVVSTTCTSSVGC